MRCQSQQCNAKDRGESGIVRKTAETSVICDVLGNAHLMVITLTYPLHPD